MKVAYILNEFAEAIELLDNAALLANEWLPPHELEKLETFISKATGNIVGYLRDRRLEMLRHISNGDNCLVCGRRTPIGEDKCDDCIEDEHKQDCIEDEDWRDYFETVVNGQP